MSSHEADVYLSFIQSYEQQISAVQQILNSTRINIQQTDILGII